MNPACPQRRRDLAAGAFAALALLAGYGRAQAQTLQISPVQLEVSPGRRSTSLLMKNLGQANAALQIRAFAWSVTPEGKDQLAPAPAVVVTPPIATVAPGQSQLVRILLTSAPPTVETAYRLSVDQLPTPASTTTPAGGSGAAVHVVFRQLLPLFVEARPGAAPALAWSLARGADGHAVLTVANHGGRHASFVVNAIELPGGARLGGSTLVHVLAGASRRWALPDTADTADRLHVLTSLADVDVVREGSAP